MPERVLVEVHMGALEKWANWGSQEAQALLSKIEARRPEYDRTVSVEGDLWEPEWKGVGKSDFSWYPIIAQLSGHPEIHIAGVQTDLCVRKTKDELLKRGIESTVIEELTLDLKK